MGKYLKDWIKHPAMTLSIAQRELLMMLYRDRYEGQPRSPGKHEAEAALLRAGYVEVVGDILKISAAGLYFWQDYLAARGEFSDHRAVSYEERMQGVEDARDYVFE